MKHRFMGGFLPDSRYRRFHPVWLFTFLRRYIFVYLLPLVRALILWDIDALSLALRQGAFLLIAAFGIALLEWRASGWFLDTDNVLHVRRGLIMRQHLRILGEELSALMTERALYLRALGAGQLTLYFKQVRRPGTLSLYLTAKDCRLLSAKLLPVGDAPFYRAVGAERLSLLLLSANTAATALFLYVSVHQTQRLGAWAELVALSGLNRAATAAATWLPVGAAWVLTAMGALLTISIIRSFFHTALYKVYKSADAVLAHGGLLHISEYRVRLSAVTACDVRVSPAARVLHCYPVYLVAGTFTGGELPVLLYRPGGEAALPQLVPGAVLPATGLRETKDRSLAAFFPASGPLAGLFLLLSILSARILPDLAPSFVLAFLLSLVWLFLCWDGRRRECVLCTGGRLTARVFRRLTLHSYCFFPCGAVYSFFQSPWAYAVRRGNLTIHLPGGQRIKVKSVTEREVSDALGSAVDPHFS